MLRRNIIYALLTGIAILYTSCSDVVKYNDGYDDQLTSYGPPTIRKIALAADTATAITQAELTKMIVLQGDNLTGVKSITINDIEVDLSTIYAIRSKITLPVPRVLPEIENNTVTVVTEKGTANFPLKVIIPDLVFDGFYNEFAQAGDTVQIMGEYLDLYQLTLADGTFTMNGASITPLRTSEDTIVFVMPTGTPDGATFSMSSPRVETPVTTKFREAGISMFDPSTVSSIYLTDGTATGDPKPIDGMSFLRIQGLLDAWSWNQFFWTNFNLTDPDVINNPNDYYVKFEMNTATSAPISEGNIIIGGGTAQYTWNPGAISAINTYGKWRTMRLELIDLFTTTSGTYLTIGSNDFTSTYQPQNQVTADLSFTNYRIVKK